MSEGRVRVVFALPQLRGGGPQRVLLKVVRYLDPGRYDVALFLVRGGRAAYEQEMPRHLRVIYASRADAGRLGWLQARFALMAVVWRDDVVVAGLELWAMHLSSIASRIRRRPCVGWARSILADYTRLDRRPAWHLTLSWHIYRPLEGVVCVAEAARAGLDMAEFRGLEATNARIIRGPSGKGAYARQKDGAEDDEWIAEAYSRNVIIGVGRLVWGKGFDVLLRRHAQLVKSRGMNNLLFFDDGPERKSLAFLAERLGVADTGFMPAFEDDVAGSTRDAEVLVSPSRTEAFGKVILGAMALGTPVVATRTGGPEEILGDGINGRLVPKDDPLAMTEAVAETLENGASAANLVTRAQSDVQRYSPQEVAGEWDVLLRGYLENKI